MAIILIAGGSGLIGTELQNHLRTKGHEVRILSRHKKSDPHSYVWDIHGRTIDSEVWKDLDVIINLNGANVVEKRWSDKRKTVLRNSRIQATNLLAEQVIQHRPQLKHFINASAMGYYGDQGDTLLHEDHPAGNDFLASLCKDWEEAALNLKGRVPVSIGRIGLYIHPDGGVYPIIKGLSRFYLASAFGNGKQWLGYTHREEYNAFIDGIIDGSIPPGVYNIVGAESLNMDQFVRDIARHANRRVILPNIPAFLLKMILGERSASLLSSHKVSAEKLNKQNFHHFKNFKESLAALKKQ